MNDRESRVYREHFLTWTPKEPSIYLLLFMMKTASVKELKQELQFRSQDELLQICLRLSKFKKENKELLTYLLFDASDEAAYIEGVKEEIGAQFEEINTKNFYYIKKSVRKIFKNLKKYIRYSGKKETEVELLIYFCVQLKNFSPSIKRSSVLKNLYERQVAQIEKNLPALHEDLQHDFELEMQELL